VVRVDCDTKDVKYVCKDDLIKDWLISPHFFEQTNTETVEACMKHLHEVSKLEDIKAKNIVTMGAQMDSYLEKIADLTTTK
jgi:hypothetical protein